MKIGYFLAKMGDELISLAEPEGRQVVEQINLYTATQYHYSNVTGNDALAIIYKLSPDEQTAVLNYEMNDGLNLVNMRDDLQKMIDVIASATTGEDNKKAAKLRLSITLMMAILVFLTSAAFSVMVVYVGWTTRVYPTWDIMALPFLIPGMVIWHVFGVLTKERKDLMLAALGRTPQATMFEKVASLIPDRTNVSAQTAEPFDPSNPNNYK